MGTKCRIVFRKWVAIKPGATNPDESWSYGHFHGGATWKAIVPFTSDELLELAEAQDAGYAPVFELELEHEKAIEHYDYQDEYDIDDDEDDDDIPY